jgi:hypothetical protein
LPRQPYCNTDAETSTARFVLRPLQPGIIPADGRLQIDAGLHRYGQQHGALQLIQAIPEGVEQIQGCLAHLHQPQQ